MCRARLALFVYVFAAFGGCIIAYRLSFNSKSNALEDVSVGIDKGATIFYGNVTPVLSDQNVTEKPFFQSSGKNIAANGRFNLETRPKGPDLAANAYTSQRQSTKELEAILEKPASATPRNRTSQVTAPLTAPIIRTGGAPPSMEEYHGLFLLHDAQKISVHGDELPDRWWEGCSHLDKGTRRHVYESRRLPRHVVKMPITQQASDFMFEECQAAADDEGHVAGSAFLQKISKESGVLQLRKTIPSFYKALRKENSHHPDSQPCIFEVSEKVRGWTLSQLYDIEIDTFRTLFVEIVTLIVATIDLLIPSGDRYKFDFVDWRKPNLIVEAPPGWTSGSVVPLISVPLKVALVDGDFVKMERPENVSEGLEDLASWLNLRGIPKGYFTTTDLAETAKAIETRAKTLKKPLELLLANDQAVPQENLQPKPRPGRRTRDQRSSS